MEEAKEEEEEEATRRAESDSPRPPIFAATNHSPPEKICFDGLAAFGGNFSRL